MSALHSPAGPMVSVEPSKELTLLWGATGEQEWTPALTTGKLFGLYTATKSFYSRKNFNCEAKSEIITLQNCANRIFYRLESAKDGLI